MMQKSLRDIRVSSPQQYFNPETNRYEDVLVYPNVPAPHDDMGPDPTFDRPEEDDWKSSKVLQLGEIGEQINALKIILQEKEIVFKKLKSELGL